MEITLLRLLLLLLLAAIPSSSDAISEAEVMAEFSSSIQGLPPHSGDPCDKTAKWSFISCDGRGRVTRLNLSTKGLNGTVPASIGQLTALQGISLQNNFLSGPIPSLAGLPLLESVYLGNNRFTSIPDDCFSNLPSLVSVSVDNNPLAPWPIPDGLKSSKNLASFSARNTSITGRIPEFLAGLPELTSLRLPYNDLTGPMPAGLTKLEKLQYVELNGNNITGTLPPFRPGVTVDTSSNPFFGKDISVDGPPSPPEVTASPLPPDSNELSAPLTPPTPTEEGAPRPKRSFRVWIVVLPVVLLLVAALGGYVWYHLRKSKQKRMAKAHANVVLHEPRKLKPGAPVMEVHLGGKGVPSVNPEGMMMSYQALRQATGNFNKANVLGKGGFGVVYRGHLNGVQIAVKKADSDAMGKKGREEFYAEIEVFKKMKHRHLVALLGYCIEGNERLLVYEYMPEGTLGQHLFGSRSPLSWSQRLLIALDVAKAIEYLHSMADGSFIHRDLKPSNILLDSSLRAKVSDFGLVKLVDKEKSMMTRLAGTFGYLAPEYAITGKVTTKIDVYSFGVILMEMIMGRKALDDSLPDEDAHLVVGFHRCFFEDRANFLSCIDPMLDLDDESRSSILRVAELATYCTAREPNQRPDMGHTIGVLTPLVNQWKPSSPSTQGSYAESSITLSERIERWHLGDCTTTMDLINSINESAEDNTSSMRSLNK